MLLNAGASHERSTLGFNHARELLTARGVENKTLTELLDVVYQSMDSTYDSLRERRDYLAYRAVHAAGAEHLERMTASDKFPVVCDQLLKSTERKTAETGSFAVKSFVDVHFRHQIGCLRVMCKTAESRSFARGGNVGAQFYDKRV